VRALGWPNWLTGVYNLTAWILGGCGLPGTRKKEPKERIVVIGDPPEATGVTVFYSFIFCFLNVLYMGTGYSEYTWALTLCRNFMR